MIRTPVRIPRANAICEWFLGGVRYEGLDHVLVLGDRPLERVLAEYVRYFNAERPHQGLAQQIPTGTGPLATTHGRGACPAAERTNACRTLTYSRGG